MMKNTVLVTAIGSFSADAVIRSCRREGFRIVGCDIYPAEWVASSMDVDVFYRAPYATDTEAYRSFIRQICETEQIDYVLPLTDAEIDVFQQWRQEDQTCPGGRAVVCMSDMETIRLCRNKGRAAKLLEEKKVCRTIPGKRLSELLSASEYSGEESFAGLSYPLIIKPEDGRSSQGLRRIFDSREMELAVSQLKGQAERYLVQPLISGGITTADVVRSHETGACVCLPRRELLRTLNGAGTSVQVFRDPALEKICEEIAGALDVKGCVNFEFIEHHTEQGETEWYFLECNPRFAGGVAFSCMAGYDMVKNHLRCFAGKEPEPAGKIQNQYIARRYTEYRMKEDTNE